MKKPIAITVISVLVLIAAIFGYRSYKADSERALAAQRLADEKAAGEQRRLEAERKATALVEAQRLADLKAKQDAVEAEKTLAALRAEQATAEAARKAAEEETARLAAETERLRKEKESAEGDARRIAEQRERDAATAEKARRQALARLEQLESEKRELADREAARVAALAKQRELEALAGQQRDLLDRSIYPSDYKRREHYYQQVEMYNSGITNPPSGEAVTPPIPPSTPEPAKQEP